jgi:hypothetical protein
LTAPSPSSWGSRLRRSRAPRTKQRR